MAGARTGTAPAAWQTAPIPCFPGRRYAIKQRIRAKSAYRVTAGSWDSGWITGEGQQAQLPPGTLLPETPAAVTLCLRNRAGETSQPYTVMLLNAAVADWDAPWIGLDDAQPERVIYLRRQLNLTQPVRHARLDLCGLGYHAAWINGTRLDDARLDPALWITASIFPLSPTWRRLPCSIPVKTK